MAHLAIVMSPRTSPLLTPAQHMNPLRLLLAVQVRVTVVGIDVLFRVQSRDLLSLKLQQGKVFVEQRPITPASGKYRGHSSWFC